LLIIFVLVGLCAKSNGMSLLIKLVILCMPILLSQLLGQTLAVIKLPGSRLICSCCGTGFVRLATAVFLTARSVTNVNVC